MPEKEPSKILETLKEIDGIVLAFIGFMILYAFSAYGITIPLVWSVVIGIAIIAAVVIYYLHKKRERKK